MPERFRVAYFLSRFPKITETFILREMLYLRKLGMDVHIFSMLPPDQTSKVHTQVSELMPYVHYSPILFSLPLILAQFHYLFYSPRKYLRAFWRAIWQTWPEPTTLLKALMLFPKAVYFAKQVEALEVNHIHAHFVWLNGVAAQTAADLTGITCSLHAHAWDIFQRKPECVRRQLQLTGTIITVSKFHHKYLAELCPRCSNNIYVVHYGLDPEEFRPGHAPVDDSKIHILTIGRLEEKKGHEYLIEACKQLAMKGYQFRCSIVGSGYLFDTLQAQVQNDGLQEYVSLLGAKNQAEIQDLFRQSDIFTLACVVAKGGDRDGMPNVLLEAMAMELPVISTPVTGNPELIRDWVNGLFVPERNAEALAQTIEQLINDPSMRCGLGQQGRQTVLAEFDIHKTASQLAGIFRGIIRG